MYNKKIERKKIIKHENYRKSYDEKLIKYERHPEGRLVIKDGETGKPIVDKSNLILWHGREILLQKLLMKNRDTNDPIDYTNLGLFWVSFGTGEADTADPLDPIPPTADSLGLANEIVIDAGNPNLADGGKKLPFSSVTFMQDSNNGNSWLIVKIDFTLDQTMANNNDINAACMWLSDSDDPAVASVFEAFSKITFSTIRKLNNRILDFEWYFYF